MPVSPRTPASLGFAMPAEWEPHAATWLAWPRNLSDWPGKFAAIPWVYGEIVRWLSRGETVRIMVDSPRTAAAAERVLARSGADLIRVELLHIPTDRSWTRDAGPLFLTRRGKVAVADLGFNAWAKYPDWKKDARVPSAAARALGCRLLAARHRGRRLVLEGGALDVNGAGCAVTTEECLLDPRVQVRNPGFTRADYEEALENTLGVSRVIWLDKGIVGDDTHGHVDDFCRFTGPATMVLCREDDPADGNHAVLSANRDRLRRARLADGSIPRVVDLPMPSPLFFDGRRLPASYANFYIANRVVLVPTFNDPNDRCALSILAGLFPGREVVGIHAVDLVWGLGTLHCMTRQQPAGELVPA